MISLRTACWFTCCFFLSTGAFGAPDSSRLLERNEKPIYIKSDQLLTDTKNRTATFSGKVTARQGELALYADKIVVHYGASSGNVEVVECSGMVRIVQKNRTGTSGNAVYDNKQGKIVLTVNPKVYQGEDMISGSEITYDIAEQNSTVTGSSTVRVEAVLHQKGKRDGDSGN